MITIDRMHNGPPGSGHGGVTAGRLAALVDPRRATVRLHAPVPLGRALRPLAGDDGSWTVADEETTVATVRPLDGHLQPDLGPIAAALVDAAEARFFSTREHPFPTCFACGPRRAAGTGGLGLRPGPVGDGRCANWWRPAVGAGRDEGSAVPHWLVWAALDCPSGIAAMELVADDEAIVTGELAVEINEPVVGGVRHQVVAHAREREGRKIASVAVLFDPDGHRIAAAQATWIAVAIPGSEGGRR